VRLTTDLSAERTPQRGQQLAGGEARSPSREAPVAADEGWVAVRALIAAAVVVGVLVAAIALWQARTVVLLLFLSYTLAAAIRPSVDSLARRRVPRWLAITLHVALMAVVIGFLLWLFVPTALRQTENALADLPAQSAQSVDEPWFDSLRRSALTSLERELRDVPSPEAAFSAALQTLAVLAGIAFTLACAVYWLTERDRFVTAILRVLPRGKRQTVHDGWLLIDLKLGAVIRTKLLLVAMTGTILSVAFWLIGLPYFLLVGMFAGIVEVVPVIGPLIAGLAAVGVGLTVSWQTALAAAGVVYGLRVVQDYVINPRLFGRAVDLPALAVLLAVSAVALLLGPFWVPLAIPITAVLSTLVDILVRDIDPADEPVPAVLVRTDVTVADRRSGSALLGRLRRRRDG
jgi:predicted PurR-regulated permease PerM